MNATEDIEAASLPTHVSLCKERYATLSAGIADLRDEVRSLRRLIFVMLVGIVIELIAVALYLGSQ